uniref:RING-type domain-containing protein n=1 Tax=Strongyloides papillosus TaxID=174720 RepID=A0A0N5CG19_STREA
MVCGLLNCISFRSKKEPDDDIDSEEKMLRKHKLEQERAHLEMIQKTLRRGYEPETEIPSQFDTVCVVCYEARASVRCFPCGHRVSCRRCTSVHQKTLRRGYEPETEIPSQFDTVCVVCYEARASVRCFPCGHRVSCRRCTSVHVNNLLHPSEDEESILKCFVCREEVIQVVVQNKKHIVTCAAYSWSKSDGRRTKPYPFADYPQESSS